MVASNKAAESAHHHRWAAAPKAAGAAQTQVAGAGYRHSQGWQDYEARDQGSAPRNQTEQIPDP
eukprot:925286-Heterocapsa_arctica.AAC.1